MINNQTQLYVTTASLPLHNGRMPLLPLRNGKMPLLQFGKMPLLLLFLQLAFAAQAQVIDLYGATAGKQNLQFTFGIRSCSGGRP